MIHSPTGYVPCGCRDCMEIAIGPEGSLCHACEDAGCDPERECQAPGAYGCDEDDEEMPADPHVAIEALLTELDEINPAARELLMPALAGIPDAALRDGAHLFWETDDATNIIAALVLATHRARAASTLVQVKCDVCGEVTTVARGIVLDPHDCGGTWR